MKQIVIPIMAALVAGAIGLFMGFNAGKASAESSARFEQVMKSAEDLRKELQSKEEEDVAKYIDGKTAMQSRDEGGLFNVKIANYVTGHVKNSASVAKVKDVKIRIDFKSKTDAVIGSKEIIIYEIIEPGQSIEFKERVDVPEKVETFSWTVLSAHPA